MKKRDDIIKITIDSPAAAGAGTQAKLIGKHYNLLVLDTGRCYRYVAYTKITEPSKYNYKYIKKKIGKLRMRDLQNKKLSSDKVAIVASIVARDKKIRKLGLKSALSSKVKNDNLIIVDKLDCDGKTSSLKKMFVSLKINSCCIIQNNDASDTFVRAIKNIPNSIVISELGANVYDILKHKKLIITESAIKKLEERLT